MKHAGGNVNGIDKCSLLSWTVCRFNGPVFSRLPILSSFSLLKSEKIDVCFFFLIESLRFFWCVFVIDDVMDFFSWFRKFQLDLYSQLVLAYLIPKNLKSTDFIRFHGSRRSSDSPRWAKTSAAFESVRKKNGWSCQLQICQVVETLGTDNANLKQ